MPPKAAPKKPAPLMPRVLLACYFVVCAAALTWPVYGWLGNTITPRVLGLPFSFAWNIGWVVMTFVVLGLFHLHTSRSGRS